MVWGLGNYERTAAQLLPAAEQVVESAAPQRGEHVVDLGCGSGNAALIAARRGAKVTGIDPEPRLLEVAAEAASAEGLAVELLQGEGAAMPLEDGVADAIVSVFGVIFAPDPEAAAAEIARVSAPAGRVAICAWIPVGTIADAIAVGREAVKAALELPEGPPPFPWHEPGALEGLFEPHGYEVATSEHTLAFTAASVEAWIEEETRDHPLQVAGAAILEPRGELEAVQAQMGEIYAAGNEDPEAFRVTSRYAVAVATR